ncbi:hypothetical protein MAR_034327 [Mya arenaria]|uniref:Uncharacterized protein n=1 Tax=Mya arenaria TaxID=6604 RepID=A0ABY7GCH4_MYAAR|nr:hypothetical protein MAR_034327 [Mya arenaria]
MDHTYASDQLQVANELKKSGATTAKPQMFNVQCQTPIWPLCSTSYETKGVGTEITTQDMGVQTDHDCISTPGSLYTLDDSDSDWAPDSPPSAANMPCSEHEEAKFIVNESCLNELLTTCTSCGMCTNIQKCAIGTGLIVKIICHACEYTKVWYSQKMCGRMPAGNLLLSGAILFSGESPSKVIKMLGFMNLTCFTDRQFYNFQQLYLVPTVLEVWKDKQSCILEEVRTSRRVVSVAADGRCCSPGHTAKYLSYTLLDLADVNVQNIITDRHSSIKKYLREEEPAINHWFDVWHVAKGVNKKLEAAGRKKGCEKLKMWARSISNHLYWCAASSAGNGPLVQAKWVSILNHVSNIHEGHNELFPTCLHGPVDRNWVKKEGQTSGLEGFHSLVCGFATKNLHFHHAQMEVRMLIAAMHWNENSSRAQQKTKDGRQMFKISFPKGRKQDGVASAVKEKQTYDYVSTLLAALLKLRQTRETHEKARLERNKLEEERKRPQPMADGKQKRCKMDIVEEHLSRFNLKKDS